MLQGITIFFSVLSAVSYLILIFPILKDDACHLYLLNFTDRKGRIHKIKQLVEGQIDRHGGIEIWIYSKICFLNSYPVQPYLGLGSWRSKALDQSWFESRDPGGRKGGQGDWNKERGKADRVGLVLNSTRPSSMTPNCGLGEWKEEAFIHCFQWVAAHGLTINSLHSGCASLAQKQFPVRALRAAPGQKARRKQCRATKGTFPLYLWKPGHNLHGTDGHSSRTGGSQRNQVIVRWCALRHALTPRLCK